MRFLRVELDDDTLDSLEMERRLIGFESRRAYVQWLIDNRASIAERPTEGEDLIEAYRDRITDLEQRLAVRTDRGPSTDGDRTAPDRDESGSETDPGQESDGWTRSKSHPSVEVRGSPRTTVSRRRPEPDVWEPAQKTAEPSAGHESDESTAERDGTAETRSSETTSAETADRFGQQRIARIQDDPLAEDADVLETVELDRLDELSRRAVAKTRTRLDRPVETGLEYRSSTTLADDTIGPGEDVVDLDTISVPGHDEDVVAARREVVGRAIALLRDEKRARKADFVDTLYDRYPAGYETADSWWACLKNAFKQVEVIDGGDGCRVWQFTG